MSYRSSAHRKFHIQYHIILVCKYRKNLLKGEVGQEMKNIFELVASRSKFSIDTMEIDKDHIHCLISSFPNISVFSIVRKLKQESTYLIWKNFENLLRKQFWKERTFLSDGYFVATIGQVSAETIRRYIENQG
ncbi:MAG: IS200/IS605 family transposase [Oligoflexia bacterium]|nr:IS200/IS605 family transposase [Oligoflexia bacterium]